MLSVITLGCNGKSSSTLGSKVTGEDCVLFVRGEGLRSSGGLYIAARSEITTLQVSKQRIKPYYQLAVSPSAALVACVSFDPYSPKERVLFVYDVASGTGRTLFSRVLRELEAPSSIGWSGDKLVLATGGGDLLTWQRGQSALRPLKVIVNKPMQVSGLSGNDVVLVGALPAWVLDSVERFLRETPEGLSLEKGIADSVPLREVLIGGLSSVSLGFESEHFVPLRLDIRKVASSVRLVVSRETKLVCYEFNNHKPGSLVASLRPPAGKRIAIARLSSDGDSVYATLWDLATSSREPEENVPIGLEQTPVADLWMKPVTTGAWRRVLRDVGPFWVVPTNGFRSGPQ